MRLLLFTAKRVGLAVPQIILVTLFAFVLLRLLPGNPAIAIVGQYATADNIRSVETSLGLDKPLPVQYGLYLERLGRGDLGESFWSTKNVSDEFAARAPATLELITISLGVTVLLGVGIGAFAALRGGGLLNGALRLYTYLAGGFPDFWLALALAFLFYFQLAWLPPPIGRLDLSVFPPTHITGFYTIDSLLTGNIEAFSSAVRHLFLPVLTLVVINTSLVMKQARATIEEALRSEFCNYARACGLPESTVLRHALRNSLPPVITLIGVIYSHLLGGAVLVENVFAWGGLGSFIVESVQRSDYFPVQGFVLVAAVFNLVVYFAVDLVHVLSDPRVEI